MQFGPFLDGNRPHRRSLCRLNNASWASRHKYTYTRWDNKVPRQYPFLIMLVLFIFRQLCIYSPVTLRGGEAIQHTFRKEALPDHSLQTRIEEQTIQLRL